MDTTYSYRVKGSNLITVDDLDPVLEQVTTGKAYKSDKTKRNSIELVFTDDAKVQVTSAAGVSPRTTARVKGSGLDASTVSASAFTVSNNSVQTTQVDGNKVYLILASNLGSTETPAINIAGGVIADKAGNAFDSKNMKAKDGLGPNMSLAKSGDLSKEKVTVTVTTDEQLSRLPSVKLYRVVDDDGGLVEHGADACIETTTEDGETVIAIATDIAPTLEQDSDPDMYECALPQDSTRNVVLQDDPRAPGGASAPPVRQTAAKAYTYTVTSSAIPAVETANDTGIIGGKFNIYATGDDTQGTQADRNTGTIGNSASANNAGAFTFQLDSKLNRNVAPTVDVGSMEDIENSTVKDVEQVDPLIVTVSYDKEKGEYPGDSYRTVSLTSAELTIRFEDGTTEDRTFNLTTDVSTPDNIKFTIPLLSPKIGDYTLTVKATDQAGNTSGEDGHTASWSVTKPSAVLIDLAPGWNLISLPFQPANPAINSVVPADHPVDIVMTYDNASGVWMVSRRDVETGLFIGDITVMTANTAYFVRTTNFKKLSLLRPPLATAAAAPPPPPAITVVEGWNLVPVVTNTPGEREIDADDYFGTLGANGWLKALSFDTLSRTWNSVTPGTSEDGDPEMVEVGKGYWLYATKGGVIIP